MVRKLDIEASDISDSEIGRNLPDKWKSKVCREAEELADREVDFEDSPEFTQFNSPASGQQTTKKVEEDDEDDEEFVPERVFPLIEELRKQDPGSESESEERPERFTLSSDLHESYIRMVQEGCSNEEWNTFCATERNRLQDDEKQWERWQNEEDVDLNEEPTTDPSNNLSKPPPPFKIPF